MKEHPATEADLRAIEHRLDAALARLRAQHLRLAEREHRLKTCVSLIRGWAQTLDNSWDRLSDDRRREGISAIRTAGDRLAEELVALLETARAEVVALDVDPVRLDLDEVLAVTTHTYDGVSDGSRVTHERGTGGAIVDVDPAALQQILGHLLENAVNYTAGEGDIVVRARRDGAEVLVEVVDSGIGIPDGDIFAPFQRGSEVATVPGTGMGLYVVQALVTAMGGSVSARRNDGTRGSTFTVRLPAAG